MDRHLLLVRHPETEANATGRWVGRGNAPFTSAGLTQVELVSTAIIDFAPDSIWSSPLERTSVPAAKAARALGLSVVHDDRLIELDFGAAEGLTFAEAAEQGIEFDFTAENRPVAAGGESRRDILARTGSALNDALGGSERLAVVTHGGVFRSALVSVLDLPFEAIWAFHIQNAAIASITLGEWGSPAQWARLEEFRVA